jgi:FkbM family methyltransferase
LRGQPIKRLAKLVLRPVAANRVHTVRSGVARGLKRKGGYAFLPAFLTPPTREERFLAGLDLRGLTVYDIGGHEGVFTLFFARAVGPRGRVIAFEPNPHSAARLLENIALNAFTNVELHRIALGRVPSTATLAVNPESTGRSRLEQPERGQVGASVAERVEVEVDSLDRWISAKGLPQADFVKIDTEGFEHEVLSGARGTLERVRPQLFIEIHGMNPEEKTKNARAVVTLLTDIGYAITHVESEQPVVPATSEIASVGHIHCVPA